MWCIEVRTPDPGRILAACSVKVSEFARQHILTKRPFQYMARGRAREKQRETVGWEGRLMALQPGFTEHLSSDLYHMQLDGPACIFTHLCLLPLHPDTFKSMTSSTLFENASVCVQYK